MHDLDAVQRVFEKMHLPAFEEFQTNSHVVRFYPSLRTRKVYKYLDAILLVNGPVLYKQHDLDNSGNELLQDLIRNDVSWDQLSGSYALVLLRDNMIRIFNDQLGVYRLFGNTGKTFISTSFLASVFSSVQQQEINKSALREKICHGFILYPETLVKGVKDITYENIILPDLQKSYRNNPRFIEGNQPVQWQGAQFKEYVGKYLSALKGKPVSLGLSAGFDSRLLLSGIKEYHPKYLFTHSTGKVHEKEKQVAAKLAAVSGDELAVLPTQKPEQLSDDQERVMLDDLLYYYDGRTANNSGAYSMTGTFEYNHHHLQHAVLGLNGKGGEVYRNYYNLPPWKISYDAFYDVHVAYSSTRFVLNEEDAKELRERFYDGIRNRISDWNNSVSKWSVQRYYSEVRQADCEGSIITAHNKITDYLAPFLDSQMLEKSYCSFQQLGLTDSFQSALINELSPELAAVPSKYGYSFNNRKLTGMLRSNFSVFIPLNSRRSHLENYFRKAVSAQRPLSNREAKACGILESVDSSVNWKNAFIHYAQKNVAMYVANFIDKASGKLKY